MTRLFLFIRAVCFNKIRQTIGTAPVIRIKKITFTSAKKRFPAFHSSIQLPASNDKLNLLVNRLHSNNLLGFPQ